MPLLGIDVSKANCEILAGAAGFEPTHGGVKVRCLTAWLRPIVRRDGFAPLSGFPSPRSALEAE